MKQERVGGIISYSFVECFEGKRVVLMTVPMMAEVDIIYKASIISYQAAKNPFSHQASFFRVQRRPVG